jgi:hypothetical protein
LFFLLVEEDSGGDQWSVITDSTNAIAPPVTYGVVPPGATVNFPPAILVAGTSYEVLVFRWTGPGRQDGALIGSKIFTPSEPPAPDNLAVSTSDNITYDLSWTISDSTAVQFYRLYMGFGGPPSLVDTTQATSVQLNTTVPTPGITFCVSSVSIGHVESGLTCASAP